MKSQSKFIIKVIFIIWGLIAFVDAIVNPVYGQNYASPTAQVTVNEEKFVYYSVKLQTTLSEELQEGQVYLLRATQGELFEIDQIIHVYYNKYEGSFFEHPSSPYTVIVVGRKRIINAGGE